ncbi:MAG: zinc ribbon domain-containing protein [Pirellulales bacterium]
MYICSQCGTSVDSASIGSERRICPDCGSPLRPGAERPWIDVARVRNLAEAGFLSDELLGLGIDARIHQLEEFSAINNRWASLYLIRVPSSMAREAATRIRHHLTDEETEAENESATFRISTHEQPTDPLLWRPVALVVLAGMASFVLGQRFSEQNEHKLQRRPPRDSLASAVEAIGQPLITEPGVGQPRHRLSFDRQRETWFLDVDRDGDGLYDSRNAFHTSGAAW